MSRTRKQGNLVTALKETKMVSIKSMKTSKKTITDQIYFNLENPRPKFCLQIKMVSQINMPSAKTVVSTAASLAASAMVIRSVARDLIPYDLQRYLLLSIRTFLQSLSSEMILIIEEFDGLVSNQMYKAADIYLGTKVLPSTKMFKVNLPEKKSKLRTSIGGNQEIIDKFNGARFKWRQITRQVEARGPAMFPNQIMSNVQTEARYFHLSFHKKHKDMVLDSYFPFILEESKRLKEEKKTLKIFTLKGDQMRRFSASTDQVWNSVNLDHPATFDTLAMDSDLKKMLVDDLEMFLKRKDFYRNVGKAWKRGYLLYGPPGTGKSSLIAAMANYLNFDVYDLELTDIQANSELRRLLIATANRSILVVEDIDCSLDLEDRRADERVLNALKSANLNQAQTVNIVHKQKANRVTLSGLLNFMDGLWSSCGDERIIVFTTNHKDRLDEALLRPGRMDVHIHMSYCKPCGFKTLAANYLGITEHTLFPEIEHLLGKASVTPAEVGEQLIKNADPDIALGGLIQFIQKKMEKGSEGVDEPREAGVGTGKSSGASSMNRMIENAAASMPVKNIAVNEPLPPFLRKFVESQNQI